MAIPIIHVPAETRETKPPVVEGEKPAPTLAGLAEKSRRLRAQADRINTEMKELEAMIAEIAAKEAIALGKTKARGELTPDAGNRGEK